MVVVCFGGINYPSTNSTCGISADIFLRGCSREPHCEGCHNPELWSFDDDRYIEITSIIEQLQKYPHLRHIAVMGGEPLSQLVLPRLLFNLKFYYPDATLWLYTSYELDEIPKEVKLYCDVIKTGKYMRENACTGILKSTNQTFWRKIRSVNGDFFVQYELV